MSQIVNSASDHFDGEKFFNLGGVTPDKGFLDLLKWNLGESKTKWPDSVENKGVPDFAKINAGVASQDEALLTFINHASFLIQIGDLNVITDPHFSKRSSPFSFVGPSRVRKPGLDFDQLPRIDVVLISHNHFDHMDLPTLERLQKKFQPVFVMPLKNKHLLKSLGPEAKFVELDWWQSHAASDKVKVYLAPAQHWSARGLSDRRESLWGAFVIEAHQHRIYFAGDTGLGPHFALTKEKIGSMDIALLPIGAYEPRWFMKEAHMNPDDAVQAHLALGSKISIAMHFATFQLTNEGIDEPVTALLEAKKKYGVEAFEIPEFGATKLYRF